MAMTRDSRALWCWAAGAVLAGAAVALASWTPPDDPRLALCAFRRLSGVACPGCGLTRALAHLAKGEWHAALVMHPLAPLVVAQAVAAWLAWSVRPRGRRLPRLWIDAPLAADAVLLLALWIVRLGAGTLPN